MDIPSEDVEEVQKQIYSGVTPCRVSRKKFSVGGGCEV